MIEYLNITGTRGLRLSRHQRMARLITLSWLTLHIISVLANADDFLIVADITTNGKIRTGSIDTLELEEIPLQNVEQPVAVDYDPVEQKVYWTDSARGTISRAFLNGTEQEELVSSMDSSTVVSEGIAIDVQNRHIYWTNNGDRKLIEKANLDGSERMVIVEGDLENPRGIVVDSVNGYVYWTDWGTPPKIERVNVNGSDRVTIVKDNITYPNGLDIDDIGQRIYWCDAGQDTIESSDLNGESRRILFANIYIIPFDIALYNNDIYWSDWNNARLNKFVKTNRYTGVSKDFISVGPNLFRLPGGLHIHKGTESSLQPPLESSTNHPSMDAKNSSPLTSNFTKSVEIGSGTTVPTETETRTTNEVQTITMITVILGSIFAVFVIIIVVVFLLRFWKRLNKKRDDIQMGTIRVDVERESSTSIDEGNENADIQLETIRVDTNVEHERSTSIDEGNENTELRRNSAVYVNDKDVYNFSRDQLQLDRELGSGRFGCVLLAYIVNHSGHRTKVAVKTPKQNAPESEKESFLSELNLMEWVKPHPHVLRLLGCCVEREPYYIVLEFMANGNLKDFLVKHRIVHDSANAKDAGNLAPKQLMLFAKQIADGMDFIASNQFIHRDLAARNVLVGEDLVCKVSDFGLARDIMDKGGIYQQRSNTQVPIRWMAIESVIEGKHTIESDVWSFGIVLWEIVTFGKMPYPDIKRNEAVQEYLRADYRMPQPKHCKKEVYDIMLSCWETDPSKRPAFSELTQQLDRILEIELAYVEVIGDSIYEDMRPVNATSE